MNDLALRTIFVESRPTARQLRKAKLVVIDGADSGKEAVVNKQRTFIGRGAVNDLELSDSKVSGSHAEIEVLENGYLLRDLGSTNGTFFHGARVREIYLRPDMVFSVGSTRVRFEPTEDVVDIPLSHGTRFGRVSGRSMRMREIFAVMEKVAPSELTVLITGETGTGKERLARSIHETSRRSDGPYVVLDCSAIPKDLAESTVFGHEKGAFTGAVSAHAGAFEQADGGTIFLDEVGELDLTLQPKLLRVLENREIKRVGGDKTINVDVRVVAATNRDLRQMVAEGTFREDLYFRLSVIQCEMPPLRERAEDIELLVDEFLELFADRRPDLRRLRVSNEAMAMLRKHSWPGNVRQLKNAVERAISLADNPVLTARDLQLGGGGRPISGLGDTGGASSESGVASADMPAVGTSPGDAPDDGVDGRVRLGLTIDTHAEFKDAKQDVIDRFEHAYLTGMLELHRGNLSAAARDVGLTRYHLRELLKKHDLLETFRTDPNDT